MKKAIVRRLVSLFFSVFFASLIGFVYLTSSSDNREIAVSTYSNFSENEIVVIDAGHGGEDGGAVSISGAIESQLNLTIAQRLDAMLGLYGVNTLLLRNSDISLHSSDAQTIREKKVSDLHNRVNTIESLKDPVVISIHQNTFSNSKYRGAQVFYADTKGSHELAERMQIGLVQTLNPGSKRKVKKAEGIYLMEHIENPGILVECGFLSNSEEEAKLSDPAYQKKLCCVIAAVMAEFVQSQYANT